MKKQCKHCFRYIVNTHLIPQRCAGCKTTYYCDKHCQESDWKNHWTHCYTSPTYKAKLIRLKNETMRLSFDILCNEKVDPGELWSDRAEAMKSFMVS